MTFEMTFDAVKEARPGRRWQARWQRSWPEYEAWFKAKGGDAGPSRVDCEAALAMHMPELLPTYRDLSRLAGGGDRAARFLSGWCPPPYLGGCTLSAHAKSGEVRLVRNYDLSPDLNEGLLLRSEWRRPVMGMVEFLWGLSDGINNAGLSIALAYGGSRDVKSGFGITHILRYVLETSDTVSEAMATLRRVPSHMAYNLVLADAQGATVALELAAGGGVRVRPVSVAANHQTGVALPDRALYTRTMEREAAAKGLLSDDPQPEDLSSTFLSQPFHQTDYANGFGTLFTAEYDPSRKRLALLWPDQRWVQSLDAFAEGQRIVRLGPSDIATASEAVETPPVWAPPSHAAVSDWIAYGLAMARRYGAVIGDLQNCCCR